MIIQSELFSRIRRIWTTDARKQIYGTFMTPKSWLHDLTHTDVV